MSTQAGVQTRIVPLLLYDDGCATCSRIARWVHKSANGRQGEPTIVERPVGNDPVELRRLNPGLDIWDAYAVSHVIMPDGSMKLGSEAVAEVLRRLPVTKWLTPCFDIRIIGVRPFQAILDLAYRVLDDIRPLLGCDSCGRSKPWVRPIERLMKWAKPSSRQSAKPEPVVHFRPLPVARQGRAGQGRYPAAPAKG
jgi:predicted DCC family thiol-disulfide oxidoreductase YuxK